MSTAATHLIITTNTKLCSALQHLYHNKHNLDIIPLETWLQRVWKTFNQSNTTLLTATQEFALWQNMIKQPLFNHAATAATAQQAWQLMHQWQLPIETLRNHELSDINHFYHWAKQMQTLCQQNQWISAAQLPEAIVNLSPNIQQSIQLAGFNNPPPQHQRLIDFLKSVAKVSHSTPSPQAKQVIHTPLSDPQQEISSMASWANQLRQQHPQANIGCVVVELDKWQFDIDYYLAEQQFSQTYQINITNPLSNQACIHSAITLLSLTSHADQLTYTTAKELLMTPYIAATSSEQFARAQLERYLVQHATSYIPIKQFISYAKQHQLDELVTRLLSLTNANYDTSQPQSYAKHAQQFQHLLQQLGWPGDGKLTTSESQAVEYLKTLLTDQFAQLDLVCAPCDTQTALTSLTQLCQQTPFQAQRQQADIIIVDPVTAIDCSFDYLWIMNSNPSANYPAFQTNPFVPLAQQQQQHKRLSQIVKQRMQHYLANATAPDSECLPAVTQKQQLFASGTLETITDNQAPSVSNDETIYGGTYIFKQQAACPFRAFAEIRLGAQAQYNEPSDGLEPMDKGILLHEVMAKLWTTLKTQQRLNELTDEELNKLIQSHIKQTMQQWQNNISTATTEKFMQLESKRLQSLIVKWLTLEKQRSPFTVSLVESPWTATIGKLTINYRIDRIDCLEDGSQMIIDYKTGRASASQWSGEQPDEPQLLIYATQHKKAVSGISFAQLRSNDVKWVTLNNVDDWPTQLNQWRELLTQLSDDFTSGEAEVAPKAEQTCRYCHLQSLCRINGQQT